MLNKLAQSEPPFFASFFSLSSHQPYSIPSEFLGQFPKGNLPIHESIGYTDYALKKFFEKAQKQSWYNNTLFIITADHTQKLETKKYQTVLGRYRVPLIFYHPKIKLESNKKVVQQVDILPSILDILDIKPEEKLLFGTSVFNDSPGKMLNFNSGNYIYRKADTMILYDKSKLKVYTVGEDGLKATLRPEQSENEYLKELKAYIQYTNNGLIRNNIYTP